MTQKSESRKARDASKKAHAAGSTCWDDLKAIYQACSYGITNAGNRINGLYQIKEVRPFLENNQEIAIHIRGAADDLRRFTERLQQIYAKHSGKSGGVVDGDADGLVDSMRLAGEYEQWQSEMEMAFLPSVEYLVSEFSNAYQRYLQSEAQKSTAEQSEIQPTKVEA